MVDSSFLKYIEEFDPNRESIFLFLEEVRKRWRWSSYGFKLKRVRKGFRTLKLVPSTSIDNLNIINSLMTNKWFKQMASESSNQHEVLFKIPVGRDSLK